MRAGLLGLLALEVEADYFDVHRLLTRTVDVQVRLLMLTRVCPGQMLPPLGRYVDKGGRGQLRLFATRVKDVQPVGIFQGTHVRGVARFRKKSLTCFVARLTQTSCYYCCCSP